MPGTSLINSPSIAWRCLRNTPERPLRQQVTQIMAPYCHGVTVHQEGDVEQNNTFSTVSSTSADVMERIQALPFLHSM